jgi:mono/diheme cytochrome c family protein
MRRLGKQIRPYLVFSLAAVLAGWLTPVRAAGPTSPLLGASLYENHCTGCHESRVHIREKRKAKSLAEVEAWVRQREAAQSLGWDDEEIKAVRDYLNSQYYHY